MPDEGDATAVADTEASSSTTSEPTGSLGVRGRPAKLPERLKEGDQDPAQGSGQAAPRWITYLQQMLNYHYQEEIVPTNGEFEWLTARAVSHFREQNGLGEGAFVDIAFWNKLGVEDAPETTSTESAGSQGQHTQSADFADVVHPVALVDLPDSELSWAAALAIVLNYGGADLTVESLCERAGAPLRRMTWHEAQPIGQSLGLRLATGQGNTAQAWAALLHDHGPVWMPDPTNEYHVVVVAGIGHDGDQVLVHLLDAESHSDSWVPFADFVSAYGITEGYQGELLACG